MRVFSLIVALILTSTPAWASSSDGWTALRNKRFGFRLEYPARLFQPDRTSQAGDGMVLVSREGSARLLVGAFVNNARHSPARYQAYLAQNSYPTFPVTYAPRGRSWFALSGEGHGKIFYDKVMFSCSGEVITSFAMKYPTALRHRFDPVVERLENSFRPGNGCD